MNDNIDFKDEKKVAKLFERNRGRGIQYILNMAYKVLGNPIVMNNTSYNLLAHTENTVTDDNLWNELTELGTFSHETVDFFSKEQFIDDVANTDIISVLKSSKLKYDRANAKIFDNDDIHIANICVVACYKPFEEKDFRNIEVICERLSIELQESEYYKDIERVFDETFVGNLIEEKKIDKSYIEDKIESIYSNLKTNLYVVIIDTTKYEHTITHLAYFRDLFKKIQSEFKYFIYLNNIVAIASTNNPMLNVDKEMNDLKKFFLKYNIYAGISSSFQNLFEIKKYYKQALNALNYGMNISNGQNIYKYDNFRLYCFLNNIKKDIDIWELCHPIVFLIQKHDKENGTSYTDFLNAYLDWGGNSHLAAKSMNMTEGEFYHRFQEVIEKFDIDLTNGNMRLSIFISLKMLSYFSH